MNKSYNLGLSGRLNTETINQLLRFLEAPCTSNVIKSFDDSIYMLDSLLVVNPSFEKEQEAVFLDFIASGRTALIQISLDLDNYKKSEFLLSKLGVQLLGAERKQKIAIKYLDKYPIEHQKNKKANISSNNKTSFSVFSIQDENIAFPIISVQKLFSKPVFAAESHYGQGTAIIMSSSCLPHDRADILNYLLLKGGTARAKHYQEILAEVKSLLPEIVEEAFQVYQEVPIEVIFRKLSQQQIYCNYGDLLLLIEELIRNGRLFAKIRGNVLVAY